jgi:hypothetical protein
MNPYIRFFGIIALAHFILWVGTMLCLNTHQKKPDYPEYTPTDPPVIPSWTPDPEERGKG